MTVDTRQTLQGAGLLVLQRVGHVLAALLFAALVPRLMGPDIYGRYALLGPLNVGLCGLALTAYAALLLGFRIVTPAEIRTVWRVLDLRRPIVRES